MEIDINPVLGIAIIIYGSFSGVFAPILMPFFLKPEFKEKFPRHMDAIQPPYVYQSKWFDPKGIILQRMALSIWIPTLLFCIYWMLSGGMQEI